MANLARQEMYFHEFITVEEIIARIGEVNVTQVQAMRSASSIPHASP